MLAGILKRLKAQRLLVSLVHSCRELEEDAVNDFEIAEILKDTNGDPDLIEKKVLPCKSSGTVGM